MTGLAENAACIRDLVCQLGESKVRTTREDLAAYETGVRYGSGLAAFAVFPSSTDEVSATLRSCLRHGITVVAQGANTGLVGAASPDGSGTHAILSLEKMSSLIEIDRLNRSVIISAGVRLSALNAKLAECGLVFPIDLGADPSIGGMIATNTGGSRFIRYGDVRRAVLGLEIVLADKKGTVLNLTSGLRKNNAGLDLKQLFIGTGGAFGVITRAEVEVRPLARHVAAALVVPNSEHVIAELLVDAERMFGETLTSFEGMSHNAMECVFRHVSRVRNPFLPDPVPAYALLIETTSTGESGDGGTELQQRLYAFLERSLKSGSITNAVLDHADQLWTIRHSISEAIQQEGRVIGLDIALRRGDLSKFHTDAYALVEKHFPWLKIFDFGHCGDGGDHFNLVWPKDGSPDFDSTIASNVREAIYELAVVKYRGSFSAEHGIGPHNQIYYDKFTADPIKAFAGQIANMFNPSNRLGRISLD